jgi:hypothetical protein
LQVLALSVVLCAIQGILSMAVIIQYRRPLEWEWGNEELQTVRLSIE